MIKKWSKAWYSFIYTGQLSLRCIFQHVRRNPARAYRRGRRLVIERHWLVALCLLFLGWRSSCCPSIGPCRLWQHAWPAGQQVCQPRILLQHPLCWWVCHVRFPLYVFRHNVFASVQVFPQDKKLLSVWLSVSFSLALVTVMSKMLSVQESQVSAGGYLIWICMTVLKKKMQHWMQDTSLLQNVEDSQKWCPISLILDWRTKSHQPY